MGVWYDERERVVCMESGRLELLCQIAKGIAAQFGSHCEVVVHDLTRHADHTIVAIENGHVSGRKVGDGASAVVLERMEHQEWEARDHLCYLTRTPEGKILKSSTIYIKNARGRVTAILAINFDISAMLLAGEALRDFISGAAVGGAGEDHQHQRCAGRAHRTVRCAGGKAGSTNE